MIEIIDFGSSKTPQISQMVDEICDCTVIPHTDFNQPGKNTQGIILSGAPIFITEIDMTHYVEKYFWLKNPSIPVFGICFGHQLIGLVHGASPSKQKEDRDLQTIEFLFEHRLNEKLAKEVDMLEDHCENISIPNGFELFATSDACINEAMIHKTLPIYGVQFHPEVSGNVGAIMLENFVNSCILPDQLSL